MHVILSADGGTNLVVSEVWDIGGAMEQLSNPMPTVRPDN